MSYVQLLAKWRLVQNDLDRIFVTHPERNNVPLARKNHLRANWTNSVIDVGRGQGASDQRQIYEKYEQNIRSRTSGISPNPHFSHYEKYAVTQSQRSQMTLGM